MSDIENTNDLPENKPSTEPVDVRRFLPVIPPGASAHDVLNALRPYIPTPTNGESDA